MMPRGRMGRFLIVSQLNALLSLKKCIPARIANKIRGFCDFRPSVPCRTVSQLFPSCFNELQIAAVGPCDIDAGIEAMGPHR